MKPKIIKYLGFAGFLTLIPLFMAARTPYSTTTSDYSNIEVKATEIDNPDSEYRTIELNIKNTGSGYIVANGVLKCYSSENDDHSFIRANIENELTGSNIIITPGNEFSFTTTTSTTIDFDKAYYRATAYIEPNFSLSYEGTNKITKDESGNYVIDAAVTGLQDSRKYDYDFIAIMEYEGNEYSFLCSEQLTEENKPMFYFYNFDFDESKAVIKNIIGFECDVYNPNYAGYALGGALYILVMSIPIIIGILLFFVLPGIILLVVFKKKRKNQQNL